MGDVYAAQNDPIAAILAAQQNGGTPNALPSGGGFTQMVFGQQGGQPSNGGSEQVQAAPPAKAPPAQGAPVPDATATMPAIQPNPLPAAAAASGQAAGDSTMMQAFKDPGALLAMASVIGQSPNWGESTLGQIARALGTGNQYVMAKNYAAGQAVRQATLDAQDMADKQSQNRYREASTAAIQQRTDESASTMGLRTQEIQTKIAQAQQAIASAKTDQARAAAQTAYQNTITGLKQKYGDAESQAEIDRSAAATDSSRAQASEANARTATMDQANRLGNMKYEALQSMDPQDRARLLFGQGGAKSLQTPEEKFQAFMSSVGKFYTTTDQKTNDVSLDMPRMMQDFKKWNVDLSGKVPGGGAPPPSMPQDNNSVRKRAQAAISQGGDKGKINDYLKSKGIQPID